MQHVCLNWLVGGIWQSEQVSFARGFKGRVCFKAVLSC